MISFRSLVLFGVIITVGWSVVSQTAQACPFCNAVSQTLSEEMATMDAVVIARLTRLPAPAQASNPGDAVPKAGFEIAHVVKGEAVVKPGQQMETVFFGQGKVGETFLVMGVDPPKIAWSTPLKVSDRAAGYIRKLLELPAKGAPRLIFFQDYLEAPDDLLSRDAYDEFARAPYADVKALQEHMNHDRLVSWIQDRELPASRRRLYLVMLSVCGSKADLPMLEAMLKSDDRRTKAGLDAMIGCYLTLAGAEGMPLIENLFLKNEKAEYADTYAAIMALRFHATETQCIPRERILVGLRHMLERPQLADLVIPDLARMEDWSQMERMVRLFKEADEKSSWVRVPVINYLRACPRPESKQQIQILEKIDPDAVKRANTFFPFGSGGSGAAPKQDDTSTAPNDSTSVVPAPSPQSDYPPASPPGEQVASRSPLGIAGATRSVLNRLTAQPANPFLLLGVFWGVGAVLMLAQWRLISGAGR